MVALLWYCHYESVTVSYCPAPFCTVLRGALQVGGDNKSRVSLLASRGATPTMTNAEAAQALKAKLLGKTAKQETDAQPPSHLSPVAPTAKAARSSEDPSKPFVVKVEAAGMKKEGEEEEEETAEDVEEELKIRLKTALKDKADAFSGGQEPEDEVRLGEDGWKKRYYETKFGCKTDDEVAQVVAHVVRAEIPSVLCTPCQQECIFARRSTECIWEPALPATLHSMHCTVFQVEMHVEGLVWVMRYFYRRVCSWT